MTEKQMESHNRWVAPFPAWFWPVVAIVLTIAVCVIDANAQSPCPLTSPNCPMPSGGQKMYQSAPTYGPKDTKDFNKLVQAGYAAEEFPKLCEIAKYAAFAQDKFALIVKSICAGRPVVAHPGPYAPQKFTPRASEKGGLIAELAALGMDGENQTCPPGTKPNPKGPYPACV